MFKYIFLEDWLWFGKVLNLNLMFSNKFLLNTLCAAQLALKKGLLVSIKGHLCLTEWHMTIPEEQVETNSPSLEVIFDTID